MVRYPFVAPVLGWMILCGCASTDVQPTVSTAVQLSSTVTDGPRCEGTPDVEGFVAHTVGKPVAVKMKSESVTQSCRCEYTTAPQWSCGGQQCESQYDLGGQNPVKCDRIEAVPAGLPEVEANVDRVDCSAIVTVKDWSQSYVTVTCTTAGPANVAVAVAGMRGQIMYLPMLFTDDGICPTSDADAGADADADAGAVAARP